MSIVIDDKIKNSILQYINENNYIESKFNSSYIKIALQNLNENNELDEYLGKIVLEEIYENCKIIRDYVAPDKEFEIRLKEAFNSYDNIPKPDDYGTFGYYSD